LDGVDFDENLQPFDLSFINEILCEVNKRAGFCLGGQPSPSTIEFKEEKGLRP
jgi:hypothetical protein